MGERTTVADVSPSERPLDLTVVRAHFPAFDELEQHDRSFFENAGGSFACSETIDALHDYYVRTKVQPFAPYQASMAAGAAMERSRARWASALGVASREVTLGPSTSMNTYVLAQAFAPSLGPGDEILVTNQDHEANTGVFRRMAERAGATVVEWRTDAKTGLLDVSRAVSLIGPRTRLVTMPHASNVIGQENDVAAVCAAAHAVGARVVVDGVSFAPHTFPDVASLGADVYLFSLYKTYSVHQGLMVVRNGLIDELPNQSHFFNDGVPDKRLNPAGPDHAQVAASGAVLDYVLALDDGEGEGEGKGDGGGGDSEAAGDEAASDSLRGAVERVSARWRAHEDTLTAPLLDALSARDDVRVLGPTTIDAVADRHRCPTVAFEPMAVEPALVVRRFVDHGVQTSSGHFYAYRVLEGLGVEPERGVVRLSAVHYTSPADVERVLGALDDVLR